VCLHPTDLIQSELALLAFDSLQQVFLKQDILMMFETEPMPLTLNPTIWVVINPAAGGPQSDYAVVSMCWIKGCVVVRVYVSVCACCVRCVRCGRCVRGERGVAAPVGVDGVDAAEPRVGVVGAGGVAGRVGMEHCVAAGGALNTRAPVTATCVTR